VAVGNVDGLLVGHVIWKSIYAPVVREVVSTPKGTTSQPGYQGPIDVQVRLKNHLSAFSKPGVLDDKIAEDLC
jgi:hypothetical protein